MRRPCCDKQDTNKGAWSKQEDQRLIEHIKAHGEGCWRTLPQAAGLLRCGKSCRLRWINYLRPDIKRGNFSEDEDELIIKLHALLGNRWSLIAGRLPGRTDNEVKNYWNSHLRKKLVRMGIDPDNHRLNQIIPRSQNSCASTSSTLAGSRYHVNEPMNNIENNDQISNTGSCLDDSTKVLPDINLEIGLAIPSPSIVIEENKNHLLTTSKRGLDYITPPTLFLFS